MTAEADTNEDAENPEWTPDEMRRARPAREVLSEIVGEQTAKEMLRWGNPNGPKETVTIPLDADVLRHFQEAGPGWENKINEALKEWVAEKARER